ncbi:MAG: hypothetical protein ACOCQX_00775 [Candidatus Nanoarchaeia archaeon]
MQSKIKRQSRITLLLLLGVFLSVILHNAITWIFGFQEPVFFILTFLFSIACIISAIYTFILISKSKKANS